MSALLRMRSLFQNPFLFLLSFILLASTVGAEQSFHNKQSSDSLIFYHIGYRDLTTNGYSKISFTLLKENIRRANRSLQQVSKIYQKANTETHKSVLRRQEALRRTIEQGENAAYYKLVQDAKIAERKFPAGTSIKIVRQGDQIAIKGNLSYNPEQDTVEILKSNFRRELQRLKDKLANYLEEVKKSVLYQKQVAETYIEHKSKLNISNELSKAYLKLGSKKIKFDYRKAAQNSRQSLFNLSSNFHSRPTIRQQVEQVASFFQSIPYKEIDDTDRFSSAGVLLPETLLDNNIGDCDSKALAMASTLINIDPNLEIFFVLIPRHAFLAINIPAERSDHKIKRNGKVYVLVETAGPSMTKVGTIYPESKAALKNNQMQLVRMN